VHHIIHWLDGGRTDINNLVMLCRARHNVIHHSEWTLRIRHGQPEFIPPKWFDHHQTPRRNARTLISVR
jgi:5-methylcytosine-specific restriction protein A